ncbi:ankyrin repeat-containing domain protein [Xylaria castorea]|nr:ankyrin repeat-containing domain protein [Xylaria castorea]
MEAAFTRDTRLGKMLLRAGADLGSKTLSLLEITCTSGGNSNSSMGFIQLLDEYGVINNYSALCCCPCPGSRLISPMAMSIARSDNRTTKFLIEKFLVESEESISLPQYSERRQCTCCASWFDVKLKAHGTGYMPLHLAIVTGNEEIIGRLLLPVMSYPPRVSVRVIREAFLFSCFAGDVNTASKLLARHSKVIIVLDTWVMTPLIATAWNTENTTIAETLLKLGADIGPARNDGLAPIHVAAFYGNTGLVQQLLLREADCNVRYKERHYGGMLVLPDGYESALQFALKGREIETARLLMPDSHLLGGELMQAVALHDDALISQLISKGANFMWTDIFNQTALEDAADKGNKALVSLYSSSEGTYYSRALWEAIQASTKLKDHSIVRLLANHRHAGEIDGYESLSLIFAIRQRKWDLVSLLLQDSFIPGPAESQRCGYLTDPTQEYTPLCAALLSENQSVIETMIRREYVLQCNDIWPLMETVHESIRQAFWDRFPLETMDLSFHRTLLLYAIESGNTQKVREYIPKIDCFDFLCKPYKPHCAFVELVPLTLATINGSTEIVRLLLDAGAEVDFTDSTAREKKAALQYAVIDGHLHLVQLLLDWGARVDPATPLEVGATALQYSAIEGHLKIAQLLVSRGADINAPPAKKCGRTALEGASEHGRLDMVQFLLKMGAQIDGQMRIYYVRSVSFAKTHGHYAVANHLMQYGSWGDRDQMLHDRRFTLSSYVYFLYEEAIDDWRIRQIKPDTYEVRSFDYYSSTSSDELDDSSDESEEGNGSEPSSASYDMDCVPQASLDDMSLRMAEPSGLYNIHLQPVEYDLASGEISTMQGVIELDGVAEDADVAQFDVGFNVASGAPEDDHTTNQLELWGPRSNFREGFSEFGMNSGAPEMNLADGWGVTLNGTEMEWEGPFSGFSEAEAGWEGPFSSFHGFNDIDIYEA